MISRFARRLTVLAGILLATGTAHAQTYPNRPIKLIVPFVAGGPTDISARIISDKLASVLGQAIIVENRPGAGSTIGATALATSPPDGYTIGLMTPSITTAPLFQGDLGWKPQDFTPITAFVDVPLYIAVNADLPVKSMQDLLALARKSPGKLNYSVSGFGVSTHLAFEWLKLRENLQITFIAYKGSADAVRDVASGQVQVYYDSLTSIAPFMQEGKMRLLATTGEKRTTAQPEIPTMAEAGIPDFVVSSWFAIFAPPKTPAPIADRLKSAMEEVGRDPATRQRLIAAGLEPIGGGPEPLTKAINDYVSRWTEVVAKTGLKPN